MPADPAVLVVRGGRTVGGVVAERMARNRRSRRAGGPQREAERSRQHKRFPME